MVLNELVVIKTGKSGTPKDDLINILEPRTISQGNHVVYWHKNDESDAYFMVVYKFKRKNVKERNRITTSSLLCYLSTATPI